MIWTIGFLGFRIFLEPFQPARLTAINVGQGDAFLLQVAGKNVMIDTGGRMDYRTKENRQGEALSVALHNADVYRLNALFLSHDDYDHDGNLVELSKHLSIPLCLTSPGEQFPDFGQVEVHHVVHTGETFLLSPASLFHSQITLTVVQEGQFDAEDKNNHCQVLLLDMGEKVLFLGDQEDTRKLSMDFLSEPLALLKVAHHGSRKGTSTDFLRNIQTKRAIISCGNRNRYGHPHEETLQRLQTMGIEVDRTDDGGNITYVHNCLPIGEPLLVFNEKETHELVSLYGAVVIGILFWALQRQTCCEIATPADFVLCENQAAYAALRHSKRDQCRAD